MPQTIELNKSQESDLEQILNELIYALKKTYSEEDLLALSLQVVGESGKRTIKSKKEVVTGLFKTIGKYSGKAFKFSKNKYFKYRKNGIEAEFAKDLDVTIKGIENSPEALLKLGNSVKDKTSDFYHNFLMKSKEDKIESVAVSLLAILIFFAAAGGEDFEGGIPDSDLNLGIGYHRHWLSHSIVIGFFVEFLMRSGVEVINVSYKNLPENHNPFWDKAYYYINKHEGVAVGAMWAGISAHLVKDSGILGHGVKPYTGLPFEMSMEAHKGLFLANGAASAMFVTHKNKKDV